MRVKLRAKFFHGMSSKTLEKKLLENQEHEKNNCIEREIAFKFLVLLHPSKNFDIKVQTLIKRAKGNEIRHI